MNGSIYFDGATHLSSAYFSIESNVRCRRHSQPGFSSIALSFVEVGHCSKTSDEKCSNAIHLLAQMLRTQMQRSRVDSLRLLENLVSSLQLEIKKLRGKYRAAVKGLKLNYHNGYI